MDRPRLSISACSTFGSTFAEDVAAYRAADLDGYGLWESKLTGIEDAAALDLLAEAGLATSIVVPDVPSIHPDGYFTTPTDPAERTRALIASIRRLAPFRPAGVLVTTGDPAGRDRVVMRRELIEGMRAVAEVAGELGIRVGLEGYRQSSGGLVTSIPDLLELADEIDPSIGVIADSWHLWDTEDVNDHLRWSASRIVGFQVCDYREPTRSWADRVLPGDGVIDWGATYRALVAGGYEGWYDIEIFSDDGRFGTDLPDSLWKLPPETFARRAVAAFEASWTAAGVGAGTR